MLKEDIGFDADGSFNVRQSALINIILGTLLLLLFFGVLITRDFERQQGFSSFLMLYLFFFLGAIICFVNAKKRKLLMSINENGIYYRNNLISNWDNFVNAYILQKDYEMSQYDKGLDDKFYIVVIFFVEKEQKDYQYEMRMSETQDKSEYQIIAAIEYFSGKELSMDVY